MHWLGITEKRSVLTPPSCKFNPEDFEHSAVTKHLLELPLISEASSTIGNLLPQQSEYFSPLKHLVFGSNFFIKHTISLSASHHYKYFHKANRFQLPRKTSIGYKLNWPRRNPVLNSSHPQASSSSSLIKKNKVNSSPWNHYSTSYKFTVAISKIIFSMSCLMTFFREDVDTDWIPGLGPVQHLFWGRAKATKKKGFQ